MKVQAYNVVEYTDMPQDIRDNLEIKANDTLTEPFEEFDTLKEFADQEGMDEEKAKEWCPIQWWAYHMYPSYDIYLPLLVNVSW